MAAKIVKVKAGGAEIPKGLGKEFQLSPGDSLESKSDGDGIAIQPAKRTDSLQREDGMWVFRAGVRLAASKTDELLEKTRRRRDFESMGRKR